MKAEASMFLHILVFQCPRCDTPIIQWTVNSMRSLEGADGASYDPQCPCGWSGNLVGAQARSHLVVPWSKAAGSPETGGGTAEEDERAGEEPGTWKPV